MIILCTCFMSFLISWGGGIFRSSRALSDCLGIAPWTNPNANLITINLDL